MAKCIFVSTSGSRGDVEPFLALTKALKTAGHNVVLSAPPDGSPHMALSLVRRESTQGMLLTHSPKPSRTTRSSESLARAGCEQKLRTHSQGVAAASQVVRSLIGAP